MWFETWIGRGSSVKFELTETVAVQDSELVLRALEKHLQKVAGEVVRAEGQITAYGIGPSPRTVNRRDTTIFEVRRIDGGTVLTASVSYQASGLLGYSPQDDIVSSKIEGAIDEMRAELKAWKPWASPALINDDETSENNRAERTQYAQPCRPFETATESWIRPEMPELKDSLRDAAPSDIREEPLATAVGLAAAPDAVEPAATAPIIAANLSPDVPEDGAATLVAAGTADYGESVKVTRRRSGVRTGGRAGARSGIRKTGFRRPASITTTQALTNELKIGITPQGDVPLRGLLTGQGLAEAPEDAAPSRYGWKIALALLCVLGLLGGAAYAMRAQLPEPLRSTAAEWSSDVVQESKKVFGIELAPTKAPVVAAEKILVQEPERTAIVPAPELAVRPESNVYFWVQDWAAALRSRDPATQATYYADTVSRYLENTAVSNDSVLKALKSDVEERSVVWNMKLEHVFVESQNATSARVRIIKHITDTTPANTAVDQLIKLRLKLVRDGETWKIVEEQVLR
jgi:hypothetical protein